MTAMKSTMIYRQRRQSLTQNIYILLFFTFLLGRFVFASVTECDGGNGKRNWRWWRWRLLFSWCCCGGWCWCFNLFCIYFKLSHTRLEQKKHMHIEKSINERGKLTEKYMFYFVFFRYFFIFCWKKIKKKLERMCFFPSFSFFFSFQIFVLRFFFSLLFFYFVRYRCSRWCLRPFVAFQSLLFRCYHSLCYRLCYRHDQSTMKDG